MLKHVQIEGTETVLLETMRQRKKPAPVASTAIVAGAKALPTSSAIVIYGRSSSHHSGGTHDSTSAGAIVAWDPCSSTNKPDAMVAWAPCSSTDMPHMSTLGFGAPRTWFSQPIGGKSQLASLKLKMRKAREVVHTFSSSESEPESDPDDAIQLGESAVSPSPKISLAYLFGSQAT